MDRNPSQAAPGVSGQGHLALLYRLSQAFGSSLDLDEVLNRVIDEVINATGAERGFVMLREADGRLVFRVARGLDQSTINDPEFQVSRSVVERVAREGQPLLTGNAQLDDSFGAATSVMILGLRSILCVPLRVKDQVLGIIYVDNRLQAGMFGQDDLDLLAAIASSAAIAIENARLYAAAQHRTAALAALQRIGLQLTSSLDLSTALDGIAESTMRLVGATDCIIYLYDESSEWFVSGIAQGAWAEKGQVYQPRPDGLTAAVTRKRAPVVIDDAVNHPLFTSGEAARWGIEAVAAYPLQSAGQFLGVVHVIYTEPHAFTQEEQRLLGLLADQAAIAVQNARLYESARTQLAELSVLHSVASAGAEATSEDTLIERVTQIIGETLYPADVFGVLLLDEDAQALHVHPSYNVAKGKEQLWQEALGRQFEDEAGRIIIPVGQGITGQVAASGKTIRTGDVTQAPGYINGGIETGSELCVPLKVGDQVIGVINTESPQPDAFSAADERLLATVAGQLATAIEKLRLYRAAQQEIAERRQAEVELRRVKDLNEGIVQNMAEGIFVVDADGYYTFVNPASAALLGCEIDELVGQHWSAFVSEDQRPLVEAAVERRRYGESDRYDLELTRKDGTRVPIQISSSPRLDPSTGVFAGTIGIFTDLTERLRAQEELRRHRDHLEELVQERTEALTESNAELEREIGERKRVAAERERLLVEAEDQARRQEALFRLSAELAATLDEEEISRSVVEGLRDTLDYDFVALGLLDEATGDRVVAASAGPIEAPARIPPGQGLSERPLLDGQLHYTPDVSQEPDYIDWLGGSEVDVPVPIGDKVAGVLVVESSQRHAFATEDFEVLNAAAQQAGLALEKARLLAAARDQARRQEALFRLSAELAATLDEEEISRSVAEGLRDTLGYDSVVLFLLDESTGDREWAASAGLAEPPGRIARGRGLSERPLLDGKLHYTPDVSQEPDYIEWMGGSEVDVPVPIGDKVAGVLSVENAQRDAFAVEDFEVLQAAAQQAGLALDKARLLAAERHRADELEALRTTMTGITSELELSTLLQTIVERAVGLLRSTGGELGLWDEDSQEIRILISHNMGGDYVGTRHAPGEGVMGRVAETGEPLIISDYLSWEGRAPQYADVQLHGVVAAPLTVGGRLVGAITVSDADPESRYGPAELNLLNLFAQQATIAIENARLYEDLRASQQYARNIIDSSLDPIIAVDRERLIVEFNRAAHETFGYQPHEVLGQPIDTLYAEPVEGQAIHDLALDQDGHSREVLNRRKDGEVFPSIVSASPLRDPQGELVGVMGISRDITERKRAEEELQRYQEQLEELVQERTAELQRSEEAYRTLYDGVPVGLYRTRPDGVAMAANPAMVQILGYPSLEALLAVDTKTLYVEPGDRARWQALMGESGVVRDFETQMYKHDGTAIWVNNTARVERDEQGRVLYYEGSLEDITERKRSEAELQKHREHLEELVTERTAKLQESEERYRSLFDGVPVGLYRTTRKGQVMDVNLAAVQMLGYPRREDLLEVITGDLFADRAEATEARELVDREEVLRDFESRLKRQDGTLIWADYTAHAVRDEEGEVAYYEGSIQDITKRKQAEEELRESEERYRTLFDGVPVGLYRVTAGGEILDANLFTVQMLGYDSREELLAKNMRQVLVRPREAVRGLLMADREGMVRDYETRLLRKDGSVIWVNYTARSVRDPDGKVQYYEGSLEDITQRKALEQEILRQKEYFEALFVGSPVAAMTTDLKGNIASWNPMAERLFGYTQEEAFGHHIDDLVANDPGIRDEASSYTEKALSEERVQATAQRTHKDGSLVDVEVSALPVKVGDGHMGFVAIYHDIGELQQARRDAEEANQAKSLFLANMSHELRTPLNAILGFSQLMDGDPNLTAEQQDNLEIINRSGEHLLALINDVLEMSKIEAGRLTLEESAFDLYQLLDSLEEMFSLRAGEKGLALNFHRDANLPCHIRADEAKLRQVLSNLLGNAVKFTGEGGVALRVRSEDVKREGASRLASYVSRITFEVEDTGPGIAQEDMEAIFEPFVQARAGQPQEGTGLGLAISRQFARMMGGDLTVRSELGKGSLFRLDLRVGLADEMEAAADEPWRRIVGLAPGQQAPDGGPFRLLVAEDQDTNQRLLVRLLEPLGFEVKVVSNGQEAVEAWEDWHPHLIWMDMRMPVMDGCEATQKIKEAPGGQDTVIIALTATAFEEERERILEAGCDDFVRKPFRQEEFFDVLARYLGVQFVYEEEAAAPMAEPEEAAAPAGAPAQTLAAQPTAWRDELRRATVRADLNGMLALVDEIRSQEPALADALTGLAQGFDYPGILALLEEAGEL